MTESAPAARTDADARPLALVTGASSGIGRELAAQFAAHGFDLVVAAEDVGIVAAAGAPAMSGGNVQPVRVDPRSADGVGELYAALTATGRPVEAAALNAGVGRGGAFLDTALEIIDLNIVSTVHLAELLLRDMAARDAGRVLITSSIVTVTSLMPGPTDTLVASSSQDDPARGWARRRRSSPTRSCPTSSRPPRTVGWPSRDPRTDAGGDRHRRRRRRVDLAAPGAVAAAG